MVVVDEARFLEPAELPFERGADPFLPGDLPPPWAAPPRQLVDAVVDEEGHRRIEVVSIERRDQLAQEPDRIKILLDRHGCQQVRWTRSGVEDAVADGTTIRRWR